MAQASEEHAAPEALEMLGADADTQACAPQGASVSLADRRFYGRRKGQPLSPRKQALLETHLPRLSVPLSSEALARQQALLEKEGFISRASKDMAAIAARKGAHKSPDSEVWAVEGSGPRGSAVYAPPVAPINLETLFGRAYSTYALEIGFGKGEHLVWQAENNPDCGFIGCEPFINGAVALLDTVVSRGLENVRIYTDDARHVMDALPEASLARVFLLHPDPWPKARHARRRFVGQANLDLIAQLLEPGGEFRVASDHPYYIEWTALQMSARQDFVWHTESCKDWLIRPADWPATRYGEKAIEGDPIYLRYQRL